MFYRLLPTLFSIIATILVIGFVYFQVVLPAFQTVVHTFDALDVNRTLGQAATTR
jgi:hypothetical protein